MPCVPCQVILWNGMAGSMLEGVTTVATSSLNGTSSAMTNAWALRWYGMIDKHCDEMQAMVNELTGVHDTPRLQAKP